MADFDSLMISAIASASNHAKWLEAKFSAVKTVSNTHVGRVGQDFVEAVCEALQLPTEFPIDASGKRNLNSPWDIKILGKHLELKTATEDVSGCFQFNHIRHHRKYDGVVCIGISPDEVRFGCYTKSEIATGAAGNLVTMDKGSSATFKLTKRKASLHPIVEFESRVRELVSRLGV